MGIFSSMTTAVSGLRAQSKALEFISGNIANSQTISFKRNEISFTEMLSTVSGAVAGGAGVVGGQVSAQGYTTNNVNGTIQSSDISTHLAINGNGYFNIVAMESESDGLPVFQDNKRYTKRGDFVMNRDGYLVNGNNYYLKGLKLDASTGNPEGSNLEVIKIENDFLAAKATNKITYHANLPQYPKTADTEESTENSELIDPANYTNNPMQSGDGIVLTEDEATFLEDSLAGGSITVYNENGSGVNVQMRWAKIENASETQSDTWNLYYNINNNISRANTDPAWKSVPTDFVFGTDGSLQNITEELSVSDMTINDNNLGEIKFNFGSSGLTQFSDSNGAIKISKFKQNGYSAGQLSELTVSNGDTIEGKYSNDQSVPLYKIQIVNFDAPNLLEKVSGEIFAETADSGQALPSTNSQVISNALEASNADIADEFSKLIITQRSYIANTRIVTTSDEMLQEIVNMKR